MGLHCGAEDFCHHPLKNGFDYYYGMPLTNTMECGNWSLLNGSLQSEIATVPTSLSRFSIYLVLSVIVAKALFKINPTLLVFPLLIWYSYQVAHYYVIRQYNCIVMRNYEVVQQPARLDQLTGDVVRETQQFIARNSKIDKPFLAYVSFHKAHTALATSSQFTGKSVHGSYGDVIMELDWAVGQILDTLTQLKLTENTVVMFSSDHGPALYMYDETTGEYQGGWAGIYRGGKGFNYEGGIRVPMIVRYPRKLQRGGVVDRPTSHLDVFPTLLKMASILYGNDNNNVNNNNNNNNQNKVETTKTTMLDGQDITDLLRGTVMSVQSKDRILFHYCGINIHAVTIEEQATNTTWKVHFQVQNPDSEDQYGRCYGDSVLNLGHNKPAIYDLTRFPREDVPLSRVDGRYERIRYLAVTKAMEFNRTVDFSVPDQLEADRNAFSYFQRVPCCKPFPHCYC